LYNTRYATDAADYFYIKTGYEHLKASFDDLLYLEATGNYVTFALKDKEVLSRITFMEAVNLLPAQKFVRVHRSFVVAINKIEKAERHQLTVKDKKIPVSEAFRQNLTAVFRH
jgi:DNA-binding LytR/AlgR family response regulator